MQILIDIAHKSIAEDQRRSIIDLYISVLIADGGDKKEYIEGDIEEETKEEVTLDTDISYIHVLLYHKVLMQTVQKYEWSRYLISCTLDRIS